DTTPSVQSNRGCWAAQRRPRSISRRIRGRARGALPSPPSPSRGRTLRALALQTRPPCCLPRSSSAWPWPRSRGGSTRDACTAWPCRPERAHHAARVRSSNLNAATIACTGHPWARTGTTRRTVSAAVRRRYNAVPVGALNVFWHSWQMNRCSFCEWIPILPLPVWPLAGQCRWGQNTVVGSMPCSSWLCVEACQEENVGIPIFVTSELHHGLVWSYPMLSHPKITPDHLAKHALVYVRQSTPKQVVHNQESQRLQYALVERARALGWHQIEVIDDDLGHSASAGTQRVGFKKLLATVVLGEVGIVLSTEVSRLSRTDKDWCHLLEICKVCDTLIGDAEHVYDVNLTDDQLILGIKGTLSVMESSVLKSRLFQGQEHKAKRGELYKLVAPGYLCLDGKSLVKDPNVRVQEAIALVFAKFRELWSVRQVFKWFHEEGIELPVNKSIHGKVQLVWQLPTYHAVKYILKNPVYAGVYVHGQRHTTLALGDDNSVRKKSVRQP